MTTSVNNIDAEKILWLVALPLSWMEKGGDG